MTAKLAGDMQLMAVPTTEDGQVVEEALAEEVLAVVGVAIPAEVDSAEVDSAEVVVGVVDSKKEKKLRKLRN